MLIGNKYILWIIVLLSVAVLQGIAISRDQLTTPREKPFLMVTEDFAFLRQVEPENMKVHPVELVASLEEMREISALTKPLAVEFEDSNSEHSVPADAGAETLKPVEPVVLKMVQRRRLKKNQELPNQQKRRVMSLFLIGSNVARPCLP